MGRWAQRQRGGGGINTPAVLSSATLDGDEHIIATFTHPVNAASFIGFSFSTVPGGFGPGSITQSTPNSVDLDFGMDVSSETGLTYNGDAANTVYPTTVPIT